LPEGKLKPLIVPIFIPNQGCPHRCVFCEQERITSQTGQPINGSEVEKTLNRAIQAKHFDRRRNPEVAFYGGTFSKLPLARMEGLLRAVVPFLEAGHFRSVRVSTRPDAVDDDRLDLMKSYGVLTVELGVQSMADDVLTLSKRGHTADDTVKGLQTLRNHGFKVGIQLMPGLPGDSERRFQSTVDAVIKLKPDMVRLYPLLVIRGTELARWYEAGRYKPLALDTAVRRCAAACIRLERENIPVIRMGLMSSPSLLKAGQIIAGPWHAAFGFLVRSHMRHAALEAALPSLGENERLKIFVPYRDIPLIRGHKNRGLELLRVKTGASVIEVEADDSIPVGGARLETA
jgi:histone acetyltransferase (RNA polymerase elongator complex component)